MLCIAYRENGHGNHRHIEPSIPALSRHLPDHLEDEVKKSEIQDQLRQPLAAQSRRQRPEQLFGEGEVIEGNRARMVKSETRIRPETQLQISRVADHQFVGGQISVGEEPRGKELRMIDDEDSRAQYQYRPDRGAQDALRSREQQATLRISAGEEGLSTAHPPFIPARDGLIVPCRPLRRQTTPGTITPEPSDHGRCRPDGGLRERTGSPPAVAAAPPSGPSPDSHRARPPWRGKASARASALNRAHEAWSRP